MDIAWAASELRKGNRVRRCCWDKSQWICIHPVQFGDLPPEKFLVRWFMNGETGSINFESWEADWDDLNADDWERYYREGEEGKKSNDRLRDQL